MKLKLTLHQAGAATPERHLLVTADATSTAADVAVALAGAEEYGGHVPGGQVTLRVLDGERSVTLAPDQTLVDSGLRSGSRIELTAAVEAKGAAVPAAVLTVISGPDAGLQVGLPVGSTEIGRAAECDVRLSDPLVSKRHARINVGQRVEVLDTNSSNGVVVGGVRMSRVTVGMGDVVRLGDTEISVSATHAASILPSTSTDIAFVRSPRVLRRPVPQERENPQVPTPPDAGSLPLLALIAPLLVGAVLFAFTRSILSVVFVALSPLLMLSSYFDQRLQGKRKLARQVEQYDAALVSLEADMTVLHDDDRAALLSLHPKLDECLVAAERRTDLLWSRRPEHPEFLALRLGTGLIPALATIGAPGSAGGLPDLLERARLARSRFEFLSDAPVTTDLRTVGGLGVCGSADALHGVGGGLVAQLAVLHSPAELVLACLTSPAARERWEWLEWLPHTSSPHSPLAGGHLAADPGTAALLLDRLEGLVGQRRDTLSSPPSPRGPMEAGEHAVEPHLPSVVVVVDQPSADIARLTRLAEQGPDVGVHFIWCADRRQDLPASCRTFLDLTDPDAPRVGMVRHELTFTPVRVESLSREHAGHVARALTPVIDGGSPVSDDSDLPRSVPVVTLLGAEAADDPEIVLDRWRENGSLVDRSDPVLRPRDQPVSLRALVGHAGTEPFALDLRLQGPHALVGGTTGAGKSEFLQAWVLGLAHALSPDRVTFLFVDYKGGAAFAKCVELPHCVGLVTDLSPHLVRRALRSLRAELHHRERLLNRKRVKDLLELEKTGDPECPPSLIIVVDEFAALKSEVPEFVDGVVDIAQRGRSLGLHLILATQRPAGVISDNLRANTNLRVALRMADESDSIDVLDLPMAAHFDSAIPGRGAAKTGPGRIATFQSGYPGSRTPSVAPSPQILVEEFDFGKGVAWRTPQPEVSSEVVEPDISRIVRTLRRASDLASVAPPRKPWLDVLAPTYNIERLYQRTDEELVLGVLDDPDHQAQVAEYFRPDTDGNILYLGAGGSGKTTALRSLALAAALTVRSGVAHVYGLDFAGGGLRLLEPMPNVSPIVMGDDEERVSRLLDHLAAVIEDRSARFAAARADSLPAYRKISGNQQEPRILLLVDGFAAMRETYDSSTKLQRSWMTFHRVLAEGRAVGVHVALTADRAGAVPMAIQSSFQRRIVLRQSDEDGYLTLNVPRDVIGPSSPPGRCLQPDNHQELQLAILGTEVAVAAQGRLIEELATEVAALGTVRPPRIEVLPSYVSTEGLPQSLAGLPVLGIEYESLQPMPFEPTGTIVVAGPVQSGRTTALRWLAESVRRAEPDICRAFLTPRRASVSIPLGWDLAASGVDEISDLLSQLMAAAEREARPGTRLLVVIEALPELANSMVDQEIAELAAACRRNGHLLIGEGEASVFGQAFGPMVNELKAGRTGLILQPDHNDGLNLVKTNLPAGHRNDFPPGRGMWVRAGKAVKVQVPRLD